MCLSYAVKIPKKKKKGKEKRKKGKEMNANVTRKPNIPHIFNKFSCLARVKESCLANCVIIIK